MKIFKSDDSFIVMSEIENCILSKNREGYKMEISMKSGNLYQTHFYTEENAKSAFAKLLNAMETM